MKNALITTFDKKGVDILAQFLVDNGFRIFSTGGTAKFLEDRGVEVTLIKDITGYPSILSGRVKTLHPTIFGGILADRERHKDEIKRYNLPLFDIVIVNLYPFEEVAKVADATPAEFIENIDIGGVALIRAAAKNFSRVAVVVDKNDYEAVKESIEEFGEVPYGSRKRLAIKAFAYTSYYDSLISHRFGLDLFEEKYLTLPFKKLFPLRYGENPHQSGLLFKSALSDSGIPQGEMLSGKPLSFNNIRDLDGALITLRDFPDAPCAVVLKHSTPCGIATAETIGKAYELALASDPLSAFGGIVGLNRRVDMECAELLHKTRFLECIVAPDYTDEALELMKKKKNRRIIKLDVYKNIPEFDCKMVSGGLLVQSRDRLEEKREDFRIVTDRAPTEDEWESLLFAWRAVKSVKSNSVLLVKGTATVGIGGGQTSRVDAAKIAVDKAGDRAKGSVAASDAFIPFPDALEVCAEAGATAVIQPGGSKGDPQAIEAANRYNIAMLFTGRRHFRH